MTLYGIIPNIPVPSSNSKSYLGLVHVSFGYSVSFFGSVILFGHNDTIFVMTRRDKGGILTSIWWLELLFVFDSLLSSSPPDREAIIHHLLPNLLNLHLHRMMKTLHHPILTLLSLLYDTYLSGEQETHDNLQQITQDSPRSNLSHPKKLQRAKCAVFRNL